MRSLPFLLLVAFVGGHTLADAAAKIEKPDFNTHIKPLLEAACVHCHNAKEHKGELNLTTKEGAIKGGENGAALVAGNSSKSPLYTTTTLDAEHDDVMPPKKEGLLTKEQSELLKLWIEQGATWPAGATLEQKTRIHFEKHIQ